MLDLKRANEQDFFKLFKKKPRTNTMNPQDGEVVPYADKYYHKVFNQFKEHPGKIVSWNWSAFLFGFVWMAYRKMYVEAIVFVILYCAMIMPMYLWSTILMAQGDTSMQTMAMQYGFYFLDFAYMMLLPGLIGNKIYFWKLKRKYARQDYQVTSALSVPHTTVFLMLLLAALGACYMLFAVPEEVLKSSRVASDEKIIWFTDTWAYIKMLPGKLGF